MWCQSENTDNDCSWLDSSSQVQQGQIGETAVETLVTTDYTLLLMKTPVEADDDSSEYTDDTSSEYTDYTSSSSRSSSQSSNSSQSSWVTVSSGHEADTESNGDCDSVVPSPTPSFDGEPSMHYYSLSRIPHGPEPTQLVEQGLIFEPGSPNVSEETLAEAFAGVEIGDDDVFSSSRPHIPVWPSTDDEKNNSGGQTTDPEYWSNSDSFDSDVAYMNFGTKKPAAERKNDSDTDGGGWIS
ncbi:hypothetical protein ACOMHN_061876 [Nucella lapillus]